jgi:signal transduction histidine kinase
MTPPVLPKEPLNAPVGWPAMLTVLLNSLMASQQRLEQIERHVLDNLGHEMRTPLTIIQGLTEMLLDDLGFGARGREAHAPELEEILRACHRLQRITERGIGLARLKLGQVACHPEIIQVGELLRETFTEFAEEAGEHRISVSLEHPASSRDEVEADGTSLEMALRALHENAIKFNRPGGSVEWSILGDERQLVLEVTNTGEVMTREHLESCLTPFAQGDASLTRRFGGLGLGLPLVREVVDLHGGRLEVSVLGGERGTRFRVTLPRVSVVS